MNTDHNSRLADTATVTTWGAWLISNITAINDVIQFFILLIGLITGIFALAWHIHRWNKRI